MASGLLGVADLTASTNTTLYTVPTAKTAAFSINFCNRGLTTVTVRLAICASGTPTTAEYLIYDVAVAGNSALERTGLLAQADKLVVVYANAANISATVYGYEE